MADRAPYAGAGPLTVDSQIHLWTSGTPGGTHHRHPFTADEAIAGMDAAGVDASVIVPPPWDPFGEDVAIDASRRPPDRFATMCTVSTDPSLSRQLAQRVGEPSVVGMR